MGFFILHCCQDNITIVYYRQLLNRPGDKCEYNVYFWKAIYMRCNIFFVNNLFVDIKRPWAIVRLGWEMGRGKAPNFSQCLYNTVEQRCVSNWNFQFIFHLKFTHTQVLLLREYAWLCFHIKYKCNIINIGATCTGIMVCAHGITWSPT